MLRPSRPEGGVTQAQAPHLPQDRGPRPACSESSLHFGGDCHPLLGAQWILGVGPQGEAGSSAAPALDPGQTVPRVSTQMCLPGAVLVSRIQTRGPARLSSGLARRECLCRSSTGLPVLEGLVSA